MTDYTYSTGRVKALESKLLTRDFIQRLSAMTKSEAGKALYDAGYGCGVAADADGMIRAELSAVRELIMQILPECIAFMLILPSDSHNMKVILKSTAVGTLDTELLFSHTVFDTEIMAACARGGEFSLLSDTIARVLNPAYDAGELKKPFSISCLCDRAFYAEAYEQSLLPQTGEVLRKWFSVKIDCMNYMSVQRARMIGMEQSALAYMLLPFGELDVSVFYDMFSHPSEDAGAFVFGAGCSDAVKASSQLIGTSLSDADAVLEAETAKLLDPYRYDTDTPLPAVIYFERKAREAAELREVFSRLK